MNEAEMIEHFAPLLRGIAAVARGFAEARATVEQLLPQIEANGWRLTAATERLWAGERDLDTLIGDADPNSAVLIRRMRELVDQPTLEETLAALPAPVRAAIEAEDGDGLSAALGGLPPEQAEQVIAALVAIGVLEPGEPDAATEPT